MFRCSSCKERKERENFPARKRLPNGIEGVCRVCRNKKRRTNPSRSKSARHNEYLQDVSADRYKRNQARRLAALGVDFHWYESQFVAQDRLCGICKKSEARINPQTGEPFLLAVDHDHETGQVRGLLCTRCNKGLGLLGDNLEGLQQAITYLKGNEK